MTRLGLSLNEAKTSVRNARQERFDFLGYSFGPHRFRKDGHWYLGASPSRKSVQRLKDKVGETLVPGNMGAWPEVRDQLNRLLRGWTGYFSYGTRLQAYRAIDYHVYDRVRHFLVRRHKVPGRGTRVFTGLIAGMVPRWYFAMGDSHPARRWATRQLTLLWPALMLAWRCMARQTEGKACTDEAPPLYRVIASAAGPALRQAALGGGAGASGGSPPVRSRMRRNSASRLPGGSAMGSSSS